MFLMKSMNVYNDPMNYDHNTVIAGLYNYVLNIPIRRIFEKDIELLGKNNTIYSDSYDEYD